ncbi:DUF192 domain-containing protein [Pengzhenrongella frigida]|uniref:DUF192 domain-containing protein n=1 Tax=Pengzhenrongella frigida TaxID=1259133 RepID=A0A4Q5N2D4_9MICO|nr:DUF192 domain-containing protein [Cellulomonas sp. HLT2-17]RYV52216.1 DUF192 domain-containing protein [Cellulomonas sp. HLT2-17]
MSSLSPTWSTPSAPFWLLVDGDRTASAWRATAAAERRTGLLGTDPLPGALWIERCSSVHTFGMRYALDLAFLDRAGRVLAVTTMATSRLGLPRLRARSVLEVPAGLLSQWRIVPGARLSLVARPDQSLVTGE